MSSASASSSVSMEDEEWESAFSRMEEEEGEGGAVGAAAPMESVEAGSRSVFRKCSLEEGGAAHASLLPASSDLSRKERRVPRPSTVLGKGELFHIVWHSCALFSTPRLADQRLSWMETQRFAASSSKEGRRCRKWRT